MIGTEFIAIFYHCVLSFCQKKKTATWKNWIVCGKKQLYWSIFSNLSLHILLGWFYVSPFMFSSFDFSSFVSGQVGLFLRSESLEFWLSQYLWSYNQRTLHTSLVWSRSAPEFGSQLISVFSERNIFSLSNWNDPHLWLFPFCRCSNQVDP